MFRLTMGIATVILVCQHQYDYAASAVIAFCIACVCVEAMKT